MEVRVVFLADRDDDVDVRSTNEVVLVIRAGREYGLGAAAVLPNEPTHVAEAMAGHEHPESALAEHEVDARRLRPRIAQCTESRDGRARRVQLREPGGDVPGGEGGFGLDQPCFDAARVHDGR